MCRRGRERERGGKKERKGTTCTRVGGGWKEGQREAEELGLVYGIGSIIIVSCMQLMRSHTNIQVKTAPKNAQVHLQ